MSSFKGCRPTISRSPRVPCGNRTRLAGLEDRRLCRSAKGTSSGRRESRTLKAHRSAVFRTAAVAHRLALPFRAAAAGIEPAIVSLTGSRLTIGLHRTKVRTVGFEPTLSGSRNRRIPRLSYVLMKSTQRELNPHVLHGEQAGCRYITGAKWDSTDSNRHHAG